MKGLFQALNSGISDEDLLDQQELEKNYSERICEDHRPAAVISWIKSLGIFDILEKILQL